MREGPILKPPIVAVLRGLGATETLDESEHGWKAVRCPFHADRVASASYNTVSQRFRCHGCGVSGDGYDVIQEVERCDFATARAKTAELCGGEAFTQGLSGAPERSRLTSRRTKERSKLVRSKYRRSRLQVMTEHPKRR